SMVEHFNASKTPMREWIYGVGHPKGNEEVYIERYERHNREVIEYFNDRGNDLLILNITGGEGWEKLCPFLGKPVPRVRFPCVNTTLDREKERRKEDSSLWQTYVTFKRNAKRLIGVR